MKSKIKKQKIGIVGIGTVGRTMADFVRPNAVYDKYKKIGSWKEINKCDIVFVCVSTPYKSGVGCDLSAINESFKNLTGDKIIIIKSTVSPGTTERLQSEYPQHTVIFNPEFLREKSAKKDMLFPDRQIIGYTKKSRKIADKILKILPKASFKKIIPATEAEMVKYFGNTFLATKVIFANQIYDLCQKIGVNYDVVKECVSVDSRVNASHLGVFCDGYRGYSGKCFPKDVKALIYFAAKKGVNLELLKVADKLNNVLSRKK